MFSIALVKYVLHRSCLISFPSSLSNLYLSLLSNMHFIALVKYVSMAIFIKVSIALVKYVFNYPCNINFYRPSQICFPSLLSNIFSITVVRYVFHYPSQISFPSPFSNIFSITMVQYMYSILSADRQALGAHTLLYKRITLLTWILIATIVIHHQPYCDFPIVFGGSKPAQHV